MKPKTALIIPDIHVGFRRASPRAWTPIHDVGAMDHVLGVAKRIRPCEVVMLGDNLDLAAFSSKFTPTPDLQQTTKRSLEVLRDYLVGLRAAVGPRCRITYLEGNHEARIERLLLGVAPEALGLAPVGSTVPALSVPGLLRLAEPDVDVTYIGPYPSRYWLWDSVLCQHGSICRKGGGRTVAGLLDAQPVNQVCGHVHRLEMAGRTLAGPTGPVTAWAMSAGTLARLDGVVPAGQPFNDWQQGYGMVRRDGKGTVTLHAMPI